MQTKMILWGTWLVILAVYFGFAAVWGALIRQPSHYRARLSVGFGLLIILPTSLALPFMTYGKMLAWGVALGIAGLFYREPRRFPAWFWNRRFLLYYFGLVMFMILAWTAGAGDPLAWLWLGLPAGIAGCLAVWRACRSYHPQSRSGPGEV